MIDILLQLLESIFSFIRAQFLIVFSYPFFPGQRIFWLYIVSSSVLAFYVFFVGTRLVASRKLSLSAFIRFLIPREIWRTSSAWLDVRYFFFHQIFRAVMFGVFLTGVLNLVFRFVTGEPNAVAAKRLTIGPDIANIAVSTAYMFVLFAFVDLVSFTLHYLQHKIPLLWEFHKVHHSPKVMHPLSNYREHPIDNIVYAVGSGAAFGLLMGLARNWFGYVPGVPLVLGIPLLAFAFNVLGYNLRHSHVWVRWPGRWSEIFASPAHHHIHHSCHPDHIDKNFAFMFPCWDVLFRTYHVPETNKDVHFGISIDGANEYKSCLGIYFIPFRNACRRLSNR